MSNTSKHSPGPFHMGSLGTIQAEPVPRPDGSGLLDLRILARMEPGLHVSPEENDANAKLFIASPELLKCCIEALDHYVSEGFGESHSANQLRQAIDKATA